MKKRLHKWFWNKISNLACYLENKSWEELWKHKEFRNEYGEK